MEQAIVVLTNVPDLDAASALARHVVTQQLAACVNILPAVQSIYRWQGQIEEANEFTVFMKTTQRHYAELEAVILGMHAYDVPEIIALPITAGLPSYLEWLVQETKKDVDV